MFVGIYGTFSNGTLGATLSEISRGVFEGISKGISGKISKESICGTYKKMFGRFF